MHRRRWSGTGAYGMDCCMIVQMPHPFTLTIVACATVAHHFRWEIRRGARLVASAKHSFPDSKDATTEGHAALRRLIADWRGRRQSVSHSVHVSRDPRGDRQVSAGL